MIDRLRRIAAGTLDLLAPRRCPGCDTSGISAPVCPTCARRLRLYPEPIIKAAQVNGVPVISLGSFEPPLSDAIKRLKYHGRTDLACPLAELYWQHRATTCLETFGHSALLIPVPLHPTRLVSRGYNQSALLGSALASLAGYRYHPARLRRITLVQAQATLERKARLQNVHNAFRVAGRPLPGHPLVLVDDVVTTGATVTACMQAAAAAGQTVAGIIALVHTKACSDEPWSRPDAA